MKIKIKGLAIAVAMLLSATAMADTSYLYWMTEGLDKFSSGWSYAKVYYTSTDGKTTGYLGSASGGEKFSSSARWDTEFYNMRVAIGSSVMSDSYKFALELFDSSNQSFAISEMLAYSALSSSITTGSFAQKDATFAFWQVPEPTSGLLAMLGFGLLALRRQQKKA